MFRIHLTNTGRLWLFISLLSAITLKANAQEITVKEGKTSIAQNEYFTLSIEIKDDEISSYTGFPDIPNFTKAGTSSSSSTNFVNGRINTFNAVIQNYLPAKQGSFKIPAYTFTINGKKINYIGCTVKVGPPNNESNGDAFSDDPFADFFNRKSSPKEFIDVKDDAFFDVSVSKNKVYLREGFNMIISFLIAENNKAELQFFQVGEQLNGILKKIKPKNCWEENFNIEEIEPEKVSINGANYTRYKIYQATYYPINTQAIQLPSVPLKMLKYKVAKDPGFFGDNYQESFKVYNSKPLTVSVVDLPAHPLKETVSVGQFRLNEKQDKTLVNTGQSINYAFSIYGAGNLNNVKFEPQNTNEKLEVYPENTLQNINRRNDYVTGTKTYNFFLVPKEKGEYDLKKSFFWVYFDPERAKYDTLKSTYRFTARGESKTTASITGNKKQDIYKDAEQLSGRLSSFGEDDSFKFYSNIAVGSLFALGLILMFVKRKPKED